MEEIIQIIKSLQDFKSANIGVLVEVYYMEKGQKQLKQSDKGVLLEKSESAHVKNLYYIRIVSESHDGLPKIVEKEYFLKLRKKSFEIQQVYESKYEKGQYIQILEKRNFKKVGKKP